MLKPADGEDGVKNAILQAVKDAGPNACPPMVVGEGIGGTFEKCAEMAKEALTRPVGQHSDIEYVRKMEEDDKNLKLVEIILDIAKFLDVPVVAEGVETKAQLDLLKCMGCQIIQGYYFSKPVPADEFEKFIVQENG